MTLAVGCAALIAPSAASAAVKAGVAEVDATWHVGASAGQYASDGSFAGDHGIDPAAHSTRRNSSYGVQSRLTVRALVVEGSNGKRVALVKNDLYIPQDLLNRRTAQLIEAKNIGIDRENLTIAVTHNHSSPYYSSISWGVWAFQDVFDARFFEYYARRMAEAVEKAAAGMKPVRVGASVGRFDKTHRHSFGPAIADDGTPAGYPESDADHDLTVIRFDDISDPGNPKPLANLVHFALHPEFLDGNDLISRDYVGPLERMVDRRSRAMTIYTQGAVGTAEPERNTYHSIHERLYFSHKEYAQAEYGASLMAQAILSVSNDVARGTPLRPSRYVPFTSDFEVAMEDRWYPGPFSHPYPGVSNCRTEQTFEGNPRIPIAGLPDCEDSLGELATPPQDPRVSAETLKQAGVPLPENYSAPSYTGLEEDVSVHLQAFRLGDILVTVCSCEQWKDQAENIETRTDKRAGNEYLGYDWSKQCTPNGDGTYGGGQFGYGDGTWDCPDPRGGRLAGVSDHYFQRMKAQVNKPANGWNDLENVATAESEPADVRKIKGNYTHDDDSRSAQLGYTLTVPLAMANDYNGYIASYREYQRGDHYRKALTGWGPHSSDYMATRLVTLGRRLKDPSHPLPKDQQEEQTLDAKITADLAHNDARAQLLGELGTTSLAAYEAALPNDGGEARAIAQPRDIERFSVAFFTWNGGSNYTDDPKVVVERRVNGKWVEWADGSGELPYTVEYPQVDQAPAYLAGGQEWRWTAHFEAFASRFDTGGRGTATPGGPYRFRVEGRRREGGAARAYSLVSDQFQVRPWSGIAVEDLRLDGDRRASFRVGPRSTRQAFGLTAEIGPIDYPDGYPKDADTQARKARFIQDGFEAVRDPDAPSDPAKIEWFCLHCSFRPWADTGQAQRVQFTFVAADGRVEKVPGALQGDRWVSSRPLTTSESALVCERGVSDRYGNVNGERSAHVGEPPPSGDPCRAR